MPVLPPVTNPTFRRNVASQGILSWQNPKQSARGRGTENDFLMMRA
jgi:hypothetical protein